MDQLIDLKTYRQRYGNKTKAVYYGLRDLIIEGVLVKGTALPATRNFADSHGLARGTVTTAYEMLMADGFLAMEQGVGTFVAFQGKPAGGKQKAKKLRLSEWGRRLPGERPVTAHREAPGSIYMQAGLPDPAYFPEEAWQKSVNRARREGNYRAAHGYRAAGLDSLREAIAGYLNRHRGLNARPENVVITNGSQQAILLLCQLLVRDGDKVVVEDPSYWGTWQAIRLQGGIVKPVALDDDGILPGDWPAHLAFLTPACQYPTTVVLSLERRREILAWAARRNAIIIEDEYDSEFLREPKLLQPLKTLDSEDRVVYLGSYSKPVGNFLRLGYAVLPDVLVEPFVRAKGIYETYTSGIIEQAALDHMIRSRAYERHIRKLNKVYLDKFELIRDLMLATFGDAFRFPPSVSGLHLFGWWTRSKAELDRLHKRATGAGIEFRIPEFNNARLARPCASFGYSHLSEKEIKKAVRELGRLL